MKIRLTLFILSVFFFASCEEYSDYDNLETIENSFTGSVSITDTAGDIDGSYSGTNDSGTYTFIWDNPTKGAVLNVDAVPGNSGAIRFVLKDSRGNESLNETLNSGESNTFSVDGKKGKWKVKIVFTQFEGEGSIDLNPVN
jgi:hypothetical protein